MIFKLIFTVFIALIFNIYIKLSYNIGTFVNISINISIKFFVSIFRIFCVFMLVCLFFFVAIILLLGISLSVLNVSCFHFTNFNPIQDGPFQSCSQMGRGGLFALKSKICHTYATLMKLGTVIPYQKIQKIHKSRDTPLDFC